MIDAARLTDSLNRLRTLDTAFQVFGAESHLYQLNPVASASAIQAFETSNSITLPAEYRDFIAHVGNGGAGPYYGMLPLGEFGGFTIGSLAEPFPYTERWNADEAWFEQLAGLYDAEQERAKRPLKELIAEPQSDANPTQQRMKMQDWYFGTCHVNGTIPLSHQGCGYYDLLVVTGPARGTVWTDGRTSDGGIVPLRKPDGSPHTFATWYDDWLATSLAEVTDTS